MGDLFITHHPFNSPLVEVCGPFTIKIINLLAQRNIKYYLSKCVDTKVVRIEVVTDITTDAFIASLVCFSSRRVLPSYLCNDCTTNLSLRMPYFRRTSGIQYSPITINPLLQTPLL